MQLIGDKVRHYRKTFRPAAFYAFRSRVFAANCFLAIVILGCLAADVWVATTTEFEFLTRNDQVWLLVAESALGLGMLQVHLLGLQRRHRRLNPSFSRAGMRAALSCLDREKRELIQRSFNHYGSLESLARGLVDQWEWRREVNVRADEPAMRRAFSFFRPPTASNFAGYMVGVVAIAAAVVISLIDRETFFSALPTFANEAWNSVLNLWLIVVVPIVICILPTAAILSMFRGSWEKATEWINDQYLSDAAFYRFIAEILDLHDRGGRRLLRQTRNAASLIVRVATCHIPELGKLWSRWQRAKRIARIRSARSTL